MQVNDARSALRFPVPPLEEKHVSWDIIGKQAIGGSLLPNLCDYDAVRKAFAWKTVRAELAMPGGLNIAYHALDRHVAEGDGDKLALRWLGKNGERRDFTYGELAGLSCRFANLLRDLGCRRGRAGVQPARPGPRALHRGTRDIAQRQCLFAAVLGLRSRAGAHPDGDRRSKSAGHDRRASTGAKSLTGAMSCPDCSMSC